MCNSNPTTDPAAMLATMHPGLALDDCAKSELARFFTKVKLAASGCWEWQAELTHNGYGRFSGKSRSVAHRWLYVLIHGRLLDGLQLDHLCRNRCCVRPDHLEPVSAAENARRAKRLITHCPKGHPYDDQNTRVYQGRRYCRACMAITGKERDRERMRGYQRAYKQRQKVKAEGGNTRDFQAVEAAAVVLKRRFGL